MFYYLSLAVALFAIGIFGLLVRKGIIGKLVSLYIMSSAVILMFVTFNKYIQSEGSFGPVFISFILLTVIPQLLLGVFLLYRHLSSPNSRDEESIDLFY
jgi:NADH:ubiquinone oxidoreductase subunit K